MKKWRPLLALITALLFFLSMPSHISEKSRATFITFLSPAWRGADAIQRAAFSFSQKKNETSETNHQLKLECAFQKQQIERLRFWLFEKERLDEEKLRFKEYTRFSKGSYNPQMEAFFDRRASYLAENLTSELCFIPAKVIFREPSLWGSSLWLGVGRRDNQRLNAEIVAPSSPVIIGSSVVGIVEEVYERKSRVRLITDSSLTPSVRTVRGGMQSHFLTRQIDELLLSLSLRPDLEGVESGVAALEKLRNALGGLGADYYLAKGYIQGQSKPLWRLGSRYLKGKGFNYDFSDEEGAARLLRSGAKTPLIQVGDLLVTTGMDGLFPPDLLVGQVTAIYPLREGGSSYEIEAMASAPELTDLREVFVLPPRLTK